MTTPPTQTSVPASDPLSLDPITLSVMIRATLDTLPHPPDAPVEQRNELRHAAYVMFATLRPRDVMEAMLAARFVALHFQIMDNMRCTAQRDVPPALKLRFRASIAALTRVQERTERDLKLRQAFPALQPAARPVAVPAPRPVPAPFAAAARRPAAGGFVAPTEAEMAQIAAKVIAMQDAEAAAAERHRAAASAADASDDDVAEAAEAEAAAVVAQARALLEETAPPAVDMGERLQAEVAARAAAAATKLAA